MTKQLSSTYPRSITVLGVGAALMLGLTGCLGSGGTKVTPAPAPTATQQNAAPETESGGSDGGLERGGSNDDMDFSDDAAASGTGSGSAGQTASPAATPAAAGGLTAPGTKLKFGETAKTHSNSDTPGSEDYKEATLDTTVTKIVAGDHADLDRFDNPEKFAGLTPYYVFVESKLTSLSKPSAGLSASYVDAQLEDGAEAQKLIFFGSMDNCESGFFETEGDGDALSYVVGSTQTSCTVFLAPTGSAVTSASYTDSTFNYANYSDNPYLDSPIVWSE